MAAARAGKGRIVKPNAKPNAKRLVSPRVAAILEALLDRADEVDALEVGRVVFNVSRSKVNSEIVACALPVRVDPSLTTEIELTII